MGSIVAELQFCQLENEVLKSQVKKNRTNLELIREKIYTHFKEIESTLDGNFQDGAIRLTQENRKKVFQIIDAELNKK